MEGVNYLEKSYKILYSLLLVFSVSLIFPTTLAFTESRVLETYTSSYTRTIFPEIHRGRIQFNFIANVSLSVSITNSTETQILWTITGTNGSCDLNVSPDQLYRAKFSKSTGYAVYIQYSVLEQESYIPAFTFLLNLLLLLTLIGLIYLKDHHRLFNH